jgi:signal transduction histidine kinase
LRSIETHLLDAGRFAAIAHLAAGLAHEIRNPLHSIGINATVVEQYLGAPPTLDRVAAMSESVSTIKEETERLAQLLNSYLGLVREEGAVGPVDLSEMCRRVAQLLAFPARKARVAIRLESQGSLPPVHGAADRIQQAVLNLALNAIQAMPAGGTVRLRAEADDRFVRLIVSDTGPGVPPELRSRIFDAGTTTKADGTGLGLPLVRAIAESHGGSVSYRPADGGGAAFTLSLPTGRAA